MSRTTKSRAVAVGAAASLAAAALVGVAGSASAAPGAVGTAVPALGSSLGTNVVSVAGTGFRDAVTGSVAVETPKVVVGATPACSASGTTVTNWSAVSATRITLTMPPTTLGAAVASSKAVICFKDKASTAWTAVPYTYAKPVVAPDVAPLTLFTPASGPMSGGQTVTLRARPDVKTGTTVTAAHGVFQPNATVFVGSVPATAVKAAGATLTFVTPVSSSQGAQTITVRTPGFADYKITPTTANAGGGYKLTRAISISPAFGSTTEATSILVKGAGFLSDSYSGDHDTDPDTDDKALKVYASDGQKFDTDGADITPTECSNVQIISDTELSCDVPAGDAGALQVTVTDQAWGSESHDATKNSVVSRSSIFVRADF